MADAPPRENQKKQSQNWPEEPVPTLLLGLHPTVSTYPGWMRSFPTDDDPLWSLKSLELTSRSSILTGWYRERERE